MTSTEVTLHSADRFEDNESLLQDGMLEIAKQLEREFESQISKCSLKFKKPSAEKAYIKYFEWNCSNNHHLLIPLIFANELINLLIEIIYLGFNYDIITWDIALVFALFKSVAIIMEVLAIFHHHSKIIVILCDFFLFFAIIAGDFGLTYIKLKSGVTKFDHIDLFISASINIQFFIVLYARSKLFLRTMIYFLISYIFWIIIENSSITNEPSYSFVKIVGFIIVAIVGVCFLYFVNKINRRNFFFLNKIFTDFKSQKDLIEHIPVPMFISDEKDVLYINNPSIKLFNLKENNSSLKIQELENIQLEEKASQTSISLLRFLNEAKVDSRNTSTLLRMKNEDKDLEGNTIPIVYNNKNCWITCFKEITEIFKRAKDQMQKKFELLVIGSITHNFRTPLNSILGISELAITTFKALPELLMQYLQKINQQSLILFNLVDNIHEYFNYKNNKLEREDTLFNPIEEINSNLSLLED